MKKYFTILFAALALCACNKSKYDPTEDKQPVPYFKYEAYGTTVRFINYSQNANSYEWEFGDGGHSNENSPYHTYKKAGSYQVTLKAFNTRSAIYVRGYQQTQTIHVSE